MNFNLVPGLVQPGSDLAPSLRVVRFTMVPAWFHLVPTWFHRSKHFVLQRFLLGSAWLHLGSKPSDFRTSIFSRGRRRGNPGRRLLRNLGRVCWTSATTSTRTLMWRASAKVCPAASKTWGATPKALPCFFWEYAVLLHMPCPGMPRRGAVGICGE